jgi:hypothetical protein
MNRHYAIRHNVGGALLVLPTSTGFYFPPSNKVASGETGRLFGDVPQS